jgi:hypothetical protein
MRLKFNGSKRLLERRKLGQQLRAMQSTCATEFNWAPDLPPVPWNEGALKRDKTSIDDQRNWQKEPTKERDGWAKNRRVIVSLPPMPFTESSLAEILSYPWAAASKR